MTCSFCHQETDSPLLPGRLLPVACEDCQSCRMSWEPQTDPEDNSTSWWAVVRLPGERTLSFVVQEGFAAWFDRKEGRLQGSELAPRERAGSLVELVEWAEEQARSLL